MSPETKIAPEESAVILADWNADIPQDSPYLVKAWRDENSDLGVALDLNQERDPETISAPIEPPVIPDGDPEDDWIGARLSGDHPNLPHSVYLSPDLSFKDPPDIEEPYEAFKELREGLAEQLNEPPTA